MGLVVKPRSASEKARCSIGVRREFLQLLQLCLCDCLKINAVHNWH